MKRLLFTATIVSTLLLASCGGGGETTKESEQAEAPKEEKELVCTFSHSNPAPEVLWVAYKYTEKTGVKGTFQEVNVSNTGSGTSIADVLNGASFSINTASSNSGDPTRDPKIQESFFGGLENGGEITGGIRNVSGNEAEGSVEATVTMNGQTQPVMGTYTVTGDELELTFEINVETWSATDALNELNKVCEDLHKGADGQSILWPDVTVFVTTTLDADCK